MTMILFEKYQANAEFRSDEFLGSIPARDSGKSWLPSWSRPVVFLTSAPPPPDYFGCGTLGHLVSRKLKELLLGAEARGEVEFLPVEVCDDRGNVYDYWELHSLLDVNAVDIERSVPVRSARGGIRYFTSVRFDESRCPPFLVAADVTFGGGLLVSDELGQSLAKSTATGFGVVPPEEWREDLRRNWRLYEKHLP